MEKSVPPVANRTKKEQTRVYAKCMHWFVVLDDFATYSNKESLMRIVNKKVCAKCVLI